ncbi:biliverdin-producing heme oxygenase [Actinomycetes bacterium KLBMP 9759]
MSQLVAESTQTPFSQFLRTATSEVHDRAHGSAYMTELLAGRLRVDEYALLAAQLYFVYSALEAAGDALADDPVARPFVIDELRRVPGLVADLEFLVGSDWESRIEALPATRRYTARLREVAQSWPGGYVAHHYTRYLGDLAGGQVVRSVLQRSYGISGAGSLFYDFAHVGNPAAFRRRYRAALDSAPFDAQERERVRDETLRAFEYNIAVLEELDAAL